MKSYRLVPSVLVLALGLGGFLMAEPPAAAKPAHAHKHAGMHLAKAIGTLESIDTAASQMALKEKDGKSVTLSFDNALKVYAGAKSAPVSQLKAGDRVRVRFDEAAKMARRIDILPAQTRKNGK